MTNSRPNPYPGPRSFQHGETLFGRQRETWDLLNLLIAERIVLLAAPSGAGKTSLVQAALAPELEKEGFRVLPIMRPGLLPDIPTPDANRYVLSLLLALEDSRPKAEQIPLPQLSKFSLSAYLEIAWPVPQDGSWYGDVLLFDQFEEVLTVDPSDRADKVEFFIQIGDLLQNRKRWALFSMREEFLAALDPYLRPIPARFDKGRRYRLDLLGPDAAQEAMQGPTAAQEPPVVFSDRAAHQLADDLRRVQVQAPDGTRETVEGPFIEPVQLQVVCRQLWDNLSEGSKCIDVDDLRAVGDVDAALRGFYASTIASVAATTRVGERTLREWIDRHLITESGFRGQVLMGVVASQGLVNAAIWPLVNAHLLRAEQRRGATWFELAHDRLILPVRIDNATWYDDNLSTLQRQAVLWDEQKRSDGLLLRGEALDEAEQWAKANQERLVPAERDFLLACQQAKRRVERERRQNQRVRILAVVAVTISLLTIIATIIAWNQTQLAQQNADLANQQLQALEGERLLVEARYHKEKLDATQAISTLIAATAYTQLGLDVVSEIADTRRYIATVLVQQGEALATQSDSQGAAAKFEEALLLNPPPDTPVYVWIEPGSFIMGSSSKDLAADPTERPEHEIALGGYWIQRTEVTNKQYARCVAAGACEAPNNKRWEMQPYENYPVTDVNWRQALDYSKWVGGRLPSEAEWEKACRSDNGRIYSWGNQPPSEERLNAFESGIGSPTMVGAYPSGAYDIFDMSGNVWEWTSTMFDFYPYNALDGREDLEHMDDRVARGGSFAVEDSSRARCATRLKLNPNQQFNNLGFRVVISDD